MSQRKKRSMESPFKLLVNSGDDSLDINESILRGHPGTHIAGVFYQKPGRSATRKGRLLGEIVGEINGKEMPVIPIEQVPDDYYIRMR